MKILITGANGQVGSSLTNKLMQKKWNILSLSQYDLDIGDEIKVKHVIEDFRPDIVINAAAFTAVDRAESEAELAYRVNEVGSRNLAQAASAVGAPIFHISTDYVFNGLSQGLYIEDDATAPQSIYGDSKLKGELEVVKVNPKHIILRTAWVFGEHGNNFVKTMIRLGRDCEQLNIVADQFGGPTYAGDIAEALIEIAHQYENSKTLHWGIYHFSGYPYVSWFEFAESIFQEAYLQNIYDTNGPVLKSITSADYTRPAKRPANSRLDCNKIQKNFNINMSDWKKALKNINSYS